MRKLWIVLALGLMACAAPADMDAAKAAVVTFHERQLAGEDTTILREAAADLRDAISAEEFARLNDAVRAAAPACEAPAASPMQWRTNRSTSGYFIELTYQRSCPNGPLTENFTFRMNQGAPFLAGYRVSGTALMQAPPPVVKPEAPVEQPMGSPT